jgi:RNA methyltransferase, TrmH family
MVELISSTSNPLIKQIRALRQHKGREETGLFLVEGIHHVGEAIEAGWEIERLIYAPEQLTSHFAQQLLEEQARGGIACAALTGNLFSAIAEKDNPQGILAVVHQRHLNLEEFNREHFQTGVALVSPQDPGNVGTILRTLDAAGADGLFLLDGGVDPYSPACVRASMGTIFWEPIMQVPFEQFTKWVRVNNYCLIGSSAHAKVDYRTFRWSKQPMILLFGNEQKGLSQEQILACETILSIPMKGRASSLNLAVAAGILLYAMKSEGD